MSDPDGFHWVGGHPVADFVNTVTDRGRSVERDGLSSYGALLRWVVKAELMDQPEANKVEDLAAAVPSGAARALEEAREVREAMHAVLLSLAQAARPPATLTAWLEALFAESGASWKLDWSEEGARRRMAPAVGVRTPTLLIVDAFVAFATSPEFSRTKICSGEDCDFVFLDLSPKQDRLWCEMRVCGNRAKVKAWRARKRQPAEANRGP